MDSRGQKTRDRAFDFNLFAAELFSAVEVLKSYSADQQEGGIAGTVSLRTPAPFDYPDFNLAMSTQAGTNDYTGDVSPRFAGLVSNTWGNWGALASIAYNRRDTEEQGANTTRWRHEGPNGADLSLLAPDLQARWHARELWVPRGNRYSIWQSEQSRLGGTGALQYDSERVNVELHGVYSSLALDRDEYHLYPRGVNLTPVIEGLSVVTEAEVNAADELVYAVYRDGQMATESRRQELDTDFRHLNLLAQWQLNDDWQLELLWGGQRSDFEMPFSAKVYTEGRSDVSVDYRPDSSFGHVRYAADLLDPAQWWMHEVDLEAYYARSEYHLFALHMSRQFGGSGNLSFGLSRKRFQNATVRGTVNNLNREAWGKARGENPDSLLAALDDRLPVEDSEVMDDHRELSWRVLDVSGVLADLAIDPAVELAAADGEVLGIDDSTNAVEEVTDAAYVKASWQCACLGRELNAGLGLRYVQMATDSEYALDTPGSYRRDYSSWLPALNLRWRWSEALQFRLAASRNIAQPDLEILGGSPSLSLLDDGTLEIEAANPRLQPYRGDSLDLAAEWYGGDGDHLALTLFAKKLGDVPVTRRRELSFAQTGLPANLLPPDAALDTPVMFTTATNSESASVLGLELAGQSELAFLGGPLAPLGALFSITLADGRVRYYGDDGRSVFRKRIPHLSRQRVNLSLFYETERWTARIASSYRSRYISEVDTAVLSEEDERGFHGSQYIDASLTWRFSDQLKLTLEAINLGDEREEQYSSSADRPYNTTTSGRTVYLGLAYQY